MVSHADRSLIPSMISLGVTLVYSFTRADIRDMIASGRGLSAPWSGLSSLTQL